MPIPYELDRLHKEGKLTEEIEDAADLRYVLNCEGLAVEQRCADGAMQANWYCGWERE